jgi:hypothetical protein
METNSHFSLEIDFQKLEPPDNWQLGVTEAWQLADGSMLWRIKGKLIAEFPSIS